MKTVEIRKNHDFSAKSKIILHIGEKEVHIKGFGLYSFELKPGETFFVSHLWTSSQKIGYTQLDQKSSFVIKPRLGKVFAWITLAIFIFCLYLLVYYKSRWSGFPLFPMAIYGGLYITVLRDRYLVIKPLVKTKDN